MNSVEKPVTEARKEFADLVNRVAYTGERVALTRRGKVMAALVSAEDLELLESLRAGRLDLTQAGPAAPHQPERPQHAPLRIAAEYRPGGPPHPPGFGR
ncbi:type II toxin-antitoxin system Phd/YefM family antitoxin [Actinomadura verrucosospora]|uniref:type II toxin-antitoxin system Phd/YefM family antitoxin n=1 Tax=Actinomadura verrucosospora TaxID=46165 RepID=UPI0015667A6E|nr:type II toxin-antitoxin system Phd/YefM family antitoxin [Actinomadura verrucosospora]